MDQFLTGRLFCTKNRVLANFNSDALCAGAKARSVAIDEENAAPDDLQFQLL